MQKHQKEEINFLLRLDLNQVPMSLPSIMPVMKQLQEALWHLNNDNERLIRTTDAITHQNQQQQYTIDDLNSRLSLWKEIMEEQSKPAPKISKPKKNWFKRLFGQ
jgi:hypothetical protein